jgi:hypothetical protein
VKEFPPQGDIFLEDEEGYRNHAVNALGWSIPDRALKESSG